MNHKKYIQFHQTHQIFGKEAAIKIYEMGKVYALQDSFQTRELEFSLVENLYSADPTNIIKPQRILNFYGISGSGKTWILQHLWLIYRAKTPCLFLTQETLAQRLSLSARAFLIAVFNDVLAQIRSFTACDISLPQQASLADFEAALQQVLRFIEKRKQLVILLLCDEYDRWPEPLRHAFEEHILRQFIHVDRIFAILATHLRISFEDQPALSYYTFAHELNAFTCQALEQQYQQYHDIAPYILRITAGLPCCVERLIEQLEQDRITTVSEFLRHEKRFVKNNYDMLLKDHILGELEPHIHDALCVLSIPRRFNIGVMNYLLPEILPEVFRKYTESSYLKLIRQLGYTALWNPARNGYSIHISVRRILAYYLKLFDEEAFLRVNSILVNMYKAQLDVSMTNVHELVEYVYHILVHLQLNPPPSFSLAQEFSQHVKRLFEQYITAYKPDIDDLNALKEMLETDDDLKDYLTRDIQQYMEHILKTFS